MATDSERYPLPNFDGLVGDAPAIADYPKTVFIKSAGGEEFPVQEWRAEDLGLGWLFRHEGDWYATTRKPVCAVGTAVIDAEPQRVSIESGDGVVVRGNGEPVKLMLTRDEIVQVWPV